MPHQIVEQLVARPSPFLKVCCIQSVEEANTAVEHGASLIGLVSSMPSGPGVIPESTILDIAAAVEDQVWTVLLTRLNTAATIVDQHRRCRTAALQLCDYVPNDELHLVRDQLPEVVLIQVIHVLSEENIRRAELVSRDVDMLLLDSGNPDAATQELGGTGRIHDWTISRTIVDSVACPTLLAGGLGPHNVSTAVEAVRPDGVDACSALRTNGRLDESKLRSVCDQLWAI